jgi:release factor glutamine methyltransferase
MDRPLHERIAAARHSLVSAGLSPEDAALDAEVLARHVLGWDRATFLIRSAEPSPSDFDARFTPLIERRTAREPVAYITGHREFWGLDFEVSPDVLIPRPETEIIVEQALARADPARPYRRVIDVGTGSGCLAVSLATEFAQAEVIATDRSERALAVAARNAQRHDVADRVRFVHADLLTGIREVANLIVSNPPYVATADAGQLQPEVVSFEPKEALFAGDDGLSVIRRLFESASANLAAGGLLVVEFGFGQAPAIVRLAAEMGWTVTVLAPDLQGIPRTAVLERPRAQISVL